MFEIMPRDIFDFFSDSPRTRLSSMPTDVYTKDGQKVLEIQVPGMTKDNLKISIFDGVLTIAADKEEKNSEKDGVNYDHREIRYHISRSFSLPAGVTEADIHPVLKDGVLTITMPADEKLVEDKTKYLEIK